jgi:hypothetical protein
MEPAQGGGVLELDPKDLGTLDLDGAWVPYADLHYMDFLPTRIKLGADEYAYNSSMIISGHGAVLPQRIKALRGAGKTPIIVERDDRYYVFVSPP